VISDLRVCFIGDSFVAGVGDPEHLGWTGRVAARTHRAGQPLTAYNLGIRRNTSEDVIARWSVECAQRLPGDCTGMIVVSFGVNDTVSENGQSRVASERSASNLAALLAQTRHEGRPVLVVGPVPVADEQHNYRISELDKEFQRICGAQQARYVDLFRSLRANPTWMHEVAIGDGAHPTADGYAACAELIWPHWSAWIDQHDAS
jgi:lysophospholipase L1-like esterase